MVGRCLAGKGIGDKRMTPKVYDFYGVERSWEWLRGKYGSVSYLDAGPLRKFALVRLQETVGPAVLKARVLDEAGGPQFTQPVANHWPDPTLQDLRESRSKSLWYPRACVQDTDNNGVTGFGLGSGSFIGDLETGGPHTVWVLSPSLPSDGVSGIGMLGGTNHGGPLDLVFQIIPADPGIRPDPPPEPDPELSTDVAALLQEVILALYAHTEILKSIHIGIAQLADHLGAS